MTLRHLRYRSLRPWLLKPRLRLALAVASAVALLVGPAAIAPGQEASPPRPVVWNVLLDDWQLLGPLPKNTTAADAADSGLDTPFVPDEADLRPGDEPVTYRGQSYTWKAWQNRVLDFNRALRPGANPPISVVAYAYTEFTSDREQPATLALGHDDSMRAWLNGEEVFRDDRNQACVLDQSLATVTLREGRNRLLLKVGQVSGNWQSIARLRPAGLETPLVSLPSSAPATGDLGRLPTLHVDLLDESGATIRSLQTSAYRAQGSQALMFEAYGEEPQAAPARVRFHYDEPGFEPQDRTVDWASLRTAPPMIAITGRGPLRGQVVDADSGEPIAGAEIRVHESNVAATSDDEGRFEAASYSPLVDAVWVVAAGYEPTQAAIPWPAQEEVSLKIPPGGHVLRGRVLTTDGEPIAEAVIRSGLRNAWLGDRYTDEEGRFEFVGIPGQAAVASYAAGSTSAAPRTAIYPTVDHPDYVAKDRFSLPLEADGVTEVEWRLETGTTIIGRVTAKEDGEPLAGITIQVGTDRFGSNSVMPQAVTDADGRYRISGIAAGSAMVHAFSPSHAPSMTTVPTSLEQPARADFELDPGKPVSGRVTDGQGNPLGEVWLITDTWNGARMFRRETRSAPNGEFYLESMPDTEAELHVMKQGYVSNRNLMVVGGNRYEIVLPPIARHKIRIRLSDTDQPPAEVAVHQGYRWQGREEISWQDNSYLDRNFSYDPAEGVYTIARDEIGNYAIFYRFRVPGYQEGVIEDPGTGGEAKSVEVLLKKSSQTRGRVVDAESGQPLAGITVALVNKNDRMRLDHYVDLRGAVEAIERFTGVQAVTAADGSFALSAPADKAGEAGVTDLLLIDPTRGFLYLRGAAQLLSQETIEIPMPAAGIVEGRVTVAGQPVAEEEIRIGWEAPGAGTNTWEFPFGFGGRVKTGVDGRFRVEGLGPGRYSIGLMRSFNWDGGGISMYLTSTKITVPPGEQVTYDITRPAGFTLSGRTLDTDNKPLARAVVTLTPAGSSRGERINAVASDAAGRFEFTHVAPGQYQLSADSYPPSPTGGWDHANQSSGAASVNVRGDATVTIRLASRATANLTGNRGLKGRVAQDFGGTMLVGDESFSIADHYGKLIAVDLWASWDAASLAAMPARTALYEEYKDSEDILFVTLCLDTDEATAHKTIEEHNIEFPVLFTGGGGISPAIRTLGIYQLPSSLLVGRDGKFASERIAGIEPLADAIETALRQEPVAPQQPAAAPRARVRVNFTLDGAKGLPGGSVKVEAIDDAGQVVAAETLTAAGHAEQLTWHYPPLDGGELRLTAIALGLAEQEKILFFPEADAEATFDFTSPRQLTGRVAADDGQTPVPGVEIALRSGDGLYQRTATSDEGGEFKVGLLPGTYWYTLKGTDDYAPHRSESPQIFVGVDDDPEPLAIAASRAVTIRGVVEDAEGRPVAGANVWSAHNQQSIVADKEGKFEVPGAPSQDKVELYARQGETWGRVVIDEPEDAEPQKIVLGRQGNDASGTAAGGKAPSLTVTPLDGGEPAEWQPAEEGQTLLVFCSLWHPASREFLERAATWVTEHNDAHLSVLSIDWSIAQARREAAALGGDLEIAFAGPGGLDLVESWGVHGPVHAFLIAPDGRLLRTPPVGKLP